MTVKILCLAFFFVGEAYENGTESSNSIYEVLLSAWAYPEKTSGWSFDNKIIPRILFEIKVHRICGGNHMDEFRHTIAFNNCLVSFCLAWVVHPQYISLSIEDLLQGSELMEHLVDVLAVGEFIHQTLGVEGIKVKDDDWAQHWHFPGVVVCELNQVCILINALFISERIHSLNIRWLHHDGLEDAGYSSFGDDHGVVLIVVVVDGGVKFIRQGLLNPIHIVLPGNSVFLIVLEHLPSILLSVVMGKVIVLPVGHSL